MYNVAIVGATGLVGKEFISLLESRDFPVKKLTLFASERSRGTTMEYRGKSIPVTYLTEQSVEESSCDFVFFSAGGVVSKQFAPLFVSGGAIVIDNSSAFRMESDVPLIVPEVNGKTISDDHTPRILANPNCSTIQMIPPLEVIHRLYELDAVVVSTYQSVSGAGMKGIDELSGQIPQIFRGKHVEPSTFPQRISFNVIPHIGPFRPDGYANEEWKMIHETRKILAVDDLPVDVTTVRVPVFYGHAEALTVRTQNKIDIHVLRKKLAETPPHVLMDDTEKLEYPTPADAAGRDEIFVGRIRYGNGGEDRHSLNMWLVADNVRIGAALNGIKIAELFTESQS